jgi:hypothetical protein
MNKREIANLISLIGIRPTGYRVKCSGYDGMFDLEVPSVRVGNAIVRALRDLAAARPDLFPPSKTTTR